MVSPNMQMVPFGRAAGCGSVLGDSKEDSREQTEIDGGQNGFREKEETLAYSLLMKLIWNWWHSSDDFNKGKIFGTLLFLHINLWVGYNKNFIICNNHSPTDCFDGL